MDPFNELTGEENRELSGRMLQGQKRENKLKADGGEDNESTGSPYSNPIVPSTEQQEKIIQRLEEIDEEFTASTRYRRKKGLIMDMLIPLEGQTEGLMDELETQVSLSKWYDVESNERYEAHPEDIQYLHDSGISEEGLEKLGYDTSVIN